MEGLEEGVEGGGELAADGGTQNREEVKNSIKHSFSAKSEVTTAFSDLKNL